MNAEAEAAAAAGAAEISILSLEMELLFGVTRSVSLALSRLTRRVVKPDRGSSKTLDQAPDLLEIQASLFFLQQHAAGLSLSLSANPFFLPASLARPSLSFPSFISV